MDEAKELLDIFLKDRSLFPEERPQQASMAHACLETLAEEKGNDCNVLLVEAGTGVGKSLAYLLPVLLQNKQAVISTATKSLQSQLYEKDLKSLESVFKNLKKPFSAFISKGRGNYLCLRKLDYQLQMGLLPDVQAIAKFYRETESGDFEELEERNFDLSPFDATNCIGSDCPYHPYSKGGEGSHRCLYFKARTKASDADIVITNHSLLAFDLMGEKGSILGKYQALIVDEAHQFPQYLRSAISHEIGERTLSQLLTEATQLVPEFLAPVYLPEEWDDLFYTAKEYAEDNGETVFPEKAGALLENLASIAPKIMELSGQILAMSGNTENEGVVREISERFATLSKIVVALSRPSKSSVLWIDRKKLRRGEQRLGMVLTPIDVSSFLKEQLYPDCSSVIYTSATLSAGGSFDYIKELLGAKEICHTQLLDSPFDYRKNALCYIAPDLPDQRSRDYHHKLQERIADLCRASKGRALVLFTSRDSMNLTLDLLEKSNPDFPHPIKSQSGSMTPQRLLEWFKKTDGAVLFGLKSFWEGIDVPGQSLSLVVIAKTPFPVPTDPVHAARSRMVEAKRGQWAPFNEISLPEAILELRQGMGRLIRKADDRGIIALLDSRILTKNYGRRITNSLGSMRITKILTDVEDFFDVSEN